MQDRSLIYGSCYIVSTYHTLSFAHLLVDTRFGSVSVIVPVNRAVIDLGVQRSLRPKFLSFEYIPEYTFWITWLL